MTMHTSRYLQDIEADRIAGKVRVLDDAEWMARWDERRRSERAAAERLAYETAAQYGFNVRLLKRVRDCCRDALHWTPPAAQRERFNRAYQIAVARQDATLEAYR